jgi:hypothetical protein
MEALRQSMKGKKPAARKRHRATNKSARQKRKKAA